MNWPVLASRCTTAELLQAAVHRSSLFSLSGLRERIFTRAFEGLVYPQIWEDPVVDLAALEITSDCHLVAIASGGCNVLSYLTADPARITAVDLNRAHVALTRLKLAAARHIASYADFYRLFGEADDSANVKLYETVVRHSLDEMTRAYWDGRDRVGRRRIEMLTRGLYRFGLLGRFIAGLHSVSRWLGTDPRLMLAARNRTEQRDFYTQKLAPLLRRRLVRWLLDSPLSLFGLGIPPAQYRALSAGGAPIACIVEERLARLACDFDLRDNYFAWQAFGQCYARDGAVPPYLEAKNFEAIKTRASRVDVRLVSITEHLAHEPDRSVDRFVLLDAPDWMSDTELNALWREITRTARAGARVVFRTAAPKTLLPGRVLPAILDKWRYESERSAQLFRQDRSAIYGGFHLYVLREPGQ